jgi:hypothetical protein
MNTQYLTSGQDLTYEKIELNFKMFICLCKHIHPQSMKEIEFFLKG